MNNENKPALSAQALCTYIGSKVFLWDRPEGRRYGTLKGFDGYRTCYVCPEGLSRVTYEHSIYNKMGFPMGNIRLQLRRVESITNEEFATFDKFPNLKLTNALRARLWVNDFSVVLESTPCADYLRTRGFDCGGFDAEGTWHSSLIDAGLADELSPNNTK